MTRAEAIAYIKQGCSWRVDTDKDPAILSMLDFIQYDELEKGSTLPWFLALEQQALSGTASTMLIAKPSGWIREMDDGAVSIRATDTGRLRFLKKVGWKQLREQFWDEEAETVDVGDPKQYCLRPSGYYFAPVPATDFTVYADYYAHDTLPSVISSGASNLWLTHAPGMLVNLTGQRIAEDLQDKDAVSKFQRRYAASVARMLGEVVLHEQENQELVMGSEA